MLDSGGVDSDLSMVNSASFFARELIRLNSVIVIFKIINVSLVVTHTTLKAFCLEALYRSIDLPVSVLLRPLKHVCELLS